MLPAPRDPILPPGASSSAGELPTLTSSSSSSHEQSTLPKYRKEWPKLPATCNYPIPTNEKVLADYSCAYVKNGLVHGRMFVSASCVLFTGQLFGSTIIYLAVRDIVAISKRNTAILFPNAVQLITKDGQKHFFSSFLYRDQAYAMILYAMEKAGYTLATALAAGIDPEEVDWEEPMSSPTNSQLQATFPPLSMSSPPLIENFDIPTSSSAAAGGVGVGHSSPPLPPLLLETAVAAEQHAPETPVKEHKAKPSSSATTSAAATSSSLTTSGISTPNKAMSYTASLTQSMMAAFNRTILGKSASSTPEPAMQQPQPQQQQMPATSAPPPATSPIPQTTTQTSAAASTTAQTNLAPTSLSAPIPSCVSTPTAPPSQQQTTDTAKNETKTETPQTTSTTPPAATTTTTTTTNDESLPPAAPLCKHFQPEVMAEPPFHEEQLPISVETFWKLFMSTKSGFWPRLYNQSGYTDIFVTNWEKGTPTTEGGNSDCSCIHRTSTFTMEVNNKFAGRRTPRVTDVQTVMLLPDGTLVAKSTSCLGNQVPYGETFQINSMIRVIPDASGESAGCTVQFVGKVMFLKSTMLRMIIERAGMTDIKAFLMNQILATIKQIISDQTASQTPSTSSSAAATSAIAETLPRIAINAPSAVAATPQQVRIQPTRAAATHVMENKPTSMIGRLLQTPGRTPPLIVTLLFFFITVLLFWSISNTLNQQALQVSNLSQHITTLQNRVNTLETALMNANITIPQPSNSPSSTTTTTTTTTTMTTEGPAYGEITDIIKALDVVRQQLHSSAPEHIRPASTEMSWVLFITAILIGLATFLYTCWTKLF